MNRMIYEKNLKKLEEKYNEIYDKVKEIELRYEEKDNTKDHQKVINDVSANDENIIGIYSNDGRLLYLNSRYNDEEFSNNWVSQYADNKFKSVYIIFGASNFKCVKKLIEVTDDSNSILVYEPDMDIFYMSITVNDITDVLENSRVVLCIKDINNRYYTEFMLSVITYQNIHLTNYCCMPNYSELYKDDWRVLIDTLKKSMEDIIISRNTLLIYSKEMIINNLYNLDDFIEQYSFNQLIDTFKNVSECNIPAIVVSAGPSLDKNIERLRDAKNRAFIIAVDTALKPLLNKDIIPDLVVTIDMEKYPIIFMHTKFKGIPVLATTEANKELIPLYTGKRFYTGRANSYLGELFHDMIGENLLPMETGGSVANNAFSAALLMGFRNIILVGQDLAYTGKKMHAEASFGKTMDDMIVDRKRYIQVEDVYGNKVDTDQIMDSYKRWFEKQIKRYDLNHIIDATEGGAKIDGTIVMTLQEAIERSCNEYIDISKIIDDIPPQFTIEQQQQLKNRINNMIHDLESAEYRIKEGIEDYGKLRKLYTQGKSDSMEFSDVVKKIGETSKYVDEEPILGLVAFYSKRTEYDILGTVYNLKEDVRDEIDDIVEKGIKMLQGYIDGIKELIEDIGNKNKVTTHMLYESIDNIREYARIVTEKIHMCDVDNIDMYMREFYKYYMQLINRIKAITIGKRELLNTKENYYDQLLNQLWEIVAFHEKEDYNGVERKMKDSNHYMNKIYKEATDFI